MDPASSGSNPPWRDPLFIALVVVVLATSGLFPLQVADVKRVTPQKLNPVTATAEEMRLDAQLESLHTCTRPWVDSARRGVALILPTNAGKTAIYALVPPLLDVMYRNPPSPDEHGGVRPRTVTFVVVPLAA
jgi:hypothetical protein